MTIFESSFKLVISNDAGIFNDVNNVHPSNKLQPTKVTDERIVITSW